ncbi:22681_t:CDS:2, partial [Cetraspora pellucida]
YNPVERSMATLLRKLVGMVLPVDHYGTHLDLQDNVIDTELDNIFRKPVVTEYIDVKGTSNSDNVSWKWIEIHTKICKYSLDIKKYNNIKYCSPKRCEKAASLLASNNADNYINYFCSVCGKYFSTVSIVTIYKKSQYSKKVSFTKHKSERLKKTKTTAKKVCPTNMDLEDQKKLI